RHRHLPQRQRQDRDRALVRGGLRPHPRDDEDGSTAHWQLTTDYWPKNPVESSVASRFPQGLFLRGDKSAIEPAGTMRQLSRLLRYFKPYWFYMLAAVVSMALVGLLDAFR